MTKQGNVSNFVDEQDTGMYEIQPVVIPRQLRNDSFRFIKLFNPSAGGKAPKNGKEPLEREWQTKNNYEYMNPPIREHLAEGGNYGVMPKGRVFILDVDDIKAFEQLDDEKVIKFRKMFGDTFTVKSGHASGNHAHYYFKTDYKDKEHKQALKIILEHPKTHVHLGEIYLPEARAFVVGANSLHESKRRYTVANDVEIKEIHPADFVDFVSQFTNDVECGDQCPRIPKAFLDSCKQSPLTVKLGLRIEDLVNMREMVSLGDGEFQGVHPKHGSTTGHNFDINIHKNVWKCFRCDSGGDPLTLLAVLYGILPCSEARGNALSSNPEIFKRLLEEMKGDERFASKLELIDEEYRKNFKTTSETFLLKYEQALRKPQGVHELFLKAYDERKKTNNFADNGYDEEVAAQEPLTLDVPEKTEPKIKEHVLVEADGYDIPPDTYSDIADDQSVGEGDPDYTVENIDECTEYERFKKSLEEPLDTDTDDIKEMKARNIFNPPPAIKLRLTVNLEKDNFISKYVDVYSQRTDGYCEYHYAASYMLLSSIVDRKAVMRMRIGDVYPNLWALMLGVSSGSRKTTSMNYGFKIADEINHEQAMFSDFTPEAMIELLSENSHRWFFKDEAGTLFAGMQKTYMSTMRDVLCKLYDNHSYTRKLRSKKEGQSEFSVTDPYLTLFLTTTFDTFRKYTSDIDIMSGLLYRFLFFVPRHNMRKTYPITPALLEDDTEDRKLVEDIMSRFKIFSTIQEPIDFMFDAKGLQFFQAWQQLREMQCDRRTNTTENSVIARLIVMAIKMSILFTIGSKEFIAAQSRRLSGRIMCGQFHKQFCKVVVPYPYVVEACRQIDEYFYPAAVYTIGDVGMDSDTNDIVKVKLAIERAGNVISKTKLMQTVHLSKKVFAETIEALIQSREIACYQRTSKKRHDRYITYYKLINTGDDESDFTFPDLEDTIDLEQQEAVTKKQAKTTTCERKSVHYDF